MSAALRLVVFIVACMAAVASQESTGTPPVGEEPNACPKGYRLMGRASERGYVCKPLQEFFKTDEHRALSETNPGFCCQKNCPEGQRLARRPLGDICPKIASYRDHINAFAAHCCYTDRQFKVTLKRACPRGMKVNETVPLDQRDCPAGNEWHEGYCCYKITELGTTTPAH